MALIEEDAVDDTFDGFIDRGVGKNNIRGFAAEFQRVFRRCSGEAFLDQAADGSRSGKRNLVDVRVFDQGCAGIAGAGDDIDHSGRQAGIADYFGELQRCQRRGLGRFEHHRIATGQRGRYFPGGHQQWEIPRNNLAGDAQCCHLLSGERIFQLVGPARVIKEMRRRQRYVDIPRLAYRLAAIERFDHRKLAGPFLHHAGNPVYVLAAFGGFQF